jgi:LysM repeat protein
MKLFHLFIASALFFSLQSYAQDAYVFKNGKKYLNYTIQTGDGLYSLSKKFHVSQQDIIDANPKTGDKIMVGTTILIPVSANEAVKNNIPTGTPVYYISQKDETLFHIANMHHVSVADLKQWNKLSSDNIAPGKKLIVGYSKTTAKDVPPATTVKTDEDYMDPKYQTEYKKKASAGSEIKEVEERGVAAWIDDGSVVSNKAIALHKTAPAGTIIKLTNLMNGKVQFVKIIGKLPDDPEHPDVTIKVTKSLARKLGVLDKYFRVEMHYSLELSK